MSLSSFTFVPSVRRQGTFPALDYELLEAAHALSDEGRVREAIAKVLAHLFPLQPVPDDLTQEPFVFTQGSSRVSVRIEGDELAISVPLVKLPGGGGTVAALRYLLTRISGSGQLHQPRLRDDGVSLEFRDQLARLHPSKLIEALRRMPLEADSSDDWLIGQFQVLPFERATIDPLEAEELARALAVWRAHWDEIEELLKESQRKRSMFFLNELTAYGLYRLRYALPLCGFVASRIEEAAGTFNDTDTDPLKREAALAKCAKDMKAVSADELAGSLGHASYAISPLQEGKPEVLTSYFKTGDYLKSIDKLRTTGKSLDAALALVSTYCYLLGRFSWPAPIAADLESGLTKISGLPWREVANTLYAHVEELIERYGDDGDDDSKDAGSAGGDAEAAADEQTGAQ
jgi:hypothetical protein